MKKSLLAILVLSVAVVAFASCSKPGNTSTLSSSEGGVAAVVNGVDISMNDLDEAAKSQLKKVETEIYQTRKRVLDDLVEDKLIEQAAKKKGLSVEKYLTEEVDAKAANPAEEEIKALYDSNKGRMGKSFDEVKDQITEYLMKGRKSRLKNELIASLRKDADIRININPPRAEIDILDSPSIGEKGAKITMIEFSDYQCPFCKRVRSTIWRLVDEYKGNFHYVFMDFPLSFHKNSKKAHEAARCAGDQGKYFEFNRKIFDNQSKITIDDLKKYAKELQLKTKEFDECLDSGKHSKDVDEAMEVGMKAGVTGTPAYFINGILISGAMPYESFKETIESELKR